jgi:hypothetical protein
MAFGLALKSMSESQKSTPDFRQRFFFVLRMRYTLRQPPITDSGTFIPMTHSFSPLRHTLELRERTQSGGRSRTEGVGSGQNSIPHSHLICITP